MIVNAARRAIDLESVQVLCDLNSHLNSGDRGSLCAPWVCSAASMMMCYGTLFSHCHERQEADMELAWLPIYERLQL